jgi:AcrR family transcriptional regulator
MNKPSKAQRETYHHGDLRRALVAAAVRVVARKGPEDISLRGLARQLGVSPRAPYRHFPSKEALLAAVSAEAFRRYEAHLDDVLAVAGEDPLERFHARGRAYVSFALAQPALFRAMNPRYGTVDEHAPELIEARMRLHAALLADIGEAQSLGRVRAGEIMGIALTAWALTHGLAVLLLEGQLSRYPAKIDPEQLSRLVGDTLFAGLAPLRTGR